MRTPFLSQGGFCSTAFTQVVKTLQNSDQDTIDRFLPRLKGVVRQAHGIGWGYYDAIAETLEEAFPQ